MRPALGPETLSRRRLLASAAVGVASGGLAQNATAQPPGRTAGGSDDLERLRHMDELERYVAVDNKCAWPNLTLMTDGSILATIFGQPCHGTCAGSAECWTSRDGGRIWTFSGVPAAHATGSYRANLAAGLTHGGAFVVLCGGGKVPDPPTGDQMCCLTPLVCRSSDGGRTWTRAESMKPPPGVDKLIPFGDIALLPGGRLAVSGYDASHDTRNTAWVFFSDDDGRTWGDARVIGADDYNETTLLVTRDGRLLAASRTLRDEHTEIFASQDAGLTWRRLGPVSLPKECPAHLFGLADGSILLTYGVRLRGMLGVSARISRDGGHTWDAPRVLFSTTVRASSTSPGGVDGGYPSSVQLRDGTIVTAYYCQRIPMHQRYHMGVVRWRV
jgi:hypothetical protein